VEGDDGRPRRRTEAYHPPADHRPAQHRHAALPPRHHRPAVLVPAGAGAPRPRRRAYPGGPAHWRWPRAPTPSRPVGSCRSGSRWPTTGCPARAGASAATRSWPVGATVARSSGAAAGPASAGGEGSSGLRFDDAVHAATEALATQ
jgi:hypothetical protein